MTEEKLNIRTRALAFMMLSLIVLFIIAPITVVLIMPESGSILLNYIMVNGPFIILFLFLFLLSEPIMHRPLKKIMEMEVPFRKNLFLSISMLSVAVYIVFSLIRHEATRINDTGWNTRLMLLLPVLIITPIQALSEEIVFRMLPYRIAFGDGKPCRLSAAMPYILISSIVFMLPHLPNAEVRTASSFIPIIYYFLWGSGAALLSVLTGGFEAAAAMHITNNLYIALIVNYEGSSLPSASVFLTEMNPDSPMVIIETIALFAVLLIYSARKGYIRISSEK